MRQFRRYFVVFLSGGFARDLEDKQEDGLAPQVHLPVGMSEDSDSSKYFAVHAFASVACMYVYVHVYGGYDPNGVAVNNS